MVREAECIGALCEFREAVRSGRGVASGGWVRGRGIDERGGWGKVLNHRGIGTPAPRETGGNRRGSKVGANDGYLGRGVGSFGGFFSLGK